ncbi:MAG: GH92 family glycosyl hydrolase [Salinivirgaceae bacterium]|jgi:predicted alpha-1,2-mannosidase|nr:GH92 family glycosyl hydrolase [Salinivirgaceae bacterium]
MKNQSILVSILFLLTLFAEKLPAQTSYAKLVDTKIGTTGKGNGLDIGFTFVGATYPFGMVQFTPTWFHPGRGITVNQLSGAGCSHMENFPTLPIAGELTTSPNDMKGFEKYKVVNDSHAGYFSMVTQDEVVCNATVTKRTGVAQFIFPQTTNKGTVIIGTGIIAGRNFSSSNVQITSPSSCEGFAEGGEFCGKETKYRVYFAAQFNTEATKTGTWNKGIVLENQLTVGGERTGAFFTFNTENDNIVEFKIAVSYVSLSNAKENLLKDNNKGDFESIKQATEKEWNNRLGRIEVKSDDTLRIKQFYTHLYHSLIHPNVFNDINGDYMGADFKVHRVEQGREHYTSFSSWDTYRSQCQLIAMLFPKEASDMMQSLVCFAEQAGGYGRWILANIETGIMNGDPSSIILSSSYAFGATDFDTEKAFQYMKMGATVCNSKSQEVLVRPNLYDYMNKGYTNNPSETLEYASADFAIGQFALQALNNKTESEYFTKRAQHWKNIYDPTTKWLRTRETSDGSWGSLSNKGYTEATRYQYFWMVPFNLKTLIDTVGYDFAANRLDSFFLKLNATYDWKDEANNQIWFASGNEPNMHVPWVYNWLGQPAKTTAVINRVINEMYDSSSSGIPGNDDLGALGSWYVFSSIGLYPMIPGVGGFAVNTPQFNDIIVHLGNKNTLNVKGGKCGLYIKTMQVNGENHNSSWIEWSDISKGGTIKYKLTSGSKSKWAIDAQLPSYN